MPVAPTYPGVYVEEIPSGVRTITGVATSITAFVGRAKRGPTNDAITINSFADFERIFGGLWLQSRMSFAVRDFYLNGGSQAVIVRLFHPTYSDNDQATALQTATVDAQAEADAIIKAINDATALPDASRDSVVAAAKKQVADASNLTPAAKWAAGPILEAVDKVPTTANATPADVLAAATAAVTEAVKAAANRAAPVTNAQIVIDTLTLTAAYQGAWGNKLVARIDTGVLDETADALNLNKADIFHLTVRDMDSGETEQFRNLTMKDNVRRVDRVLKNESRLVQAVAPGATAAAPQPTPAPGPGKQWYQDKDKGSYKPVTVPASDGEPLVLGDFTGSEDKKTGLYALEKTDLFNLLCIPPYVTSDQIDYDIDSNLIDTVTAYCTKRRALYIIDPPSKWKDKDLAKTGVASDIGSASTNAAVFFPRLLQSNPLHGNQIENFVPCGAVAGIFARTDTQRGVWKAPAGLDAILVGVPQLAENLTDPETGELNPLGVNCLRVMQPVGRVVWGARTRVGDDRLASEWKYIPVRRLALYIEESLFRGTQWVVFEPNDEPLWAQIRLNVGAFMQNLYRQGAFQGRSSRDAYFVKCDSETTTQNHINLGIVNIVVGFAPLKPAEFVIIQLQQMAGQIAV